MSIVALVAPRSLLEARDTGGTVTLDTGVAPTGYTVSVKAVSTTTGSAYFTVAAPGANGQPTTALDIEPSFITFWWRIAALPSAREQILRVIDNLGGLKGSLTIDNAGTIELFDSAGAEIGTGSTTTFAVDTWYKLQVKMGDATNDAFEFRYNGSAEISGTGTGADNHDYFRFGKATNLNGNVMTQYFAGMIVEDTGFGTDIDDAVIAVIGANANGSTQDWGTVPSGSADYTQVDDIVFGGTGTNDGSTTYVQSDAVNEVALFGLESSTTASIGSDIRAVCAVTIGVFGTSYLRLRTESTSYDLTAANFGAGYTSKQRVDTVNPNTSSAWTTAQIDALEIGEVEDAGSGARVRLTSAYALVAYVPSSSSNYTLTGSVTHTLTPAGTFSINRQHSIAGAVTLTLTPSATLTINRAYSLSGTVTLTLSPAATMAYTAAGSASITGDVTYTLTPSATFAINRAYTLSGAVTHTLSVAAAMQYTAQQAIEFVGAVTYTMTPQAEMVGPAAVVTTTTRAGGIGHKRRTRYPRRIRINGTLYTVKSEAEEKRLLEQWRQSMREQAAITEHLGDMDIAQAITKKAVRISSRIAKVESAHFARLRDEDEEILAILLAA